MKKIKLRKPNSKILLYLGILHILGGCAELVIAYMQYNERGYSIVDMDKTFRFFAFGIALTLTFLIANKLLPPDNDDAEHDNNE